MRSFYRFAALLLLSLVCLNTSLAQEKTPVYFQVCLWPGGSPPGVLTRKEDGSIGGSEVQGNVMQSYRPPIIQYCPDGVGESSDVNAVERQISPTYKYDGLNPLRFFQETLAPDGSITRKVIAEVNIPQNIKRALLVFYPRKSEAWYDVILIDNSIEHIRPGEALVLNLTASAVACMFNKQQLILQPMGSDIAELGPVANFTAIVRIGSADGNGEWRERHAERLFVESTDRVLALIHTKPGRESQYRILVLKNPLDSDTSMDDSSVN